jgi:hypothetical protein
MERSPVKSRSILLLALGALATWALPSPAEPQVREAAFTVGGTAVVKQAGQPPVVDRGVMTCSRTTGEGIGGACLSFPGGPVDPIPGFVAVNDAVAGPAVAFQVCVDNDGDGRCITPKQGRPCDDDVFFSHDDRGTFFNPLGPLPPYFRQGCPGGPWRGYVVFICNGVHDAGGAHSHPATRGVAVLTPSGQGFGNFCGGTPQAPSDKLYLLTS